MGLGASPFHLSVRVVGEGRVKVIELVGISIELALGEEKEVVVVVA